LLPAGRPWQGRALPALGAVPADPFAVGATVRSMRRARPLPALAGPFRRRLAGADGPAAGAAQEALAALFGDDGCAFNHCRTPIGANDISRGWYSYDETPGDYDLAHFTIANDRDTLIPFIQAAQRLRPDLKVWASPWSPPPG
jgi:glucosylceramidase